MIDSIDSIDAIDSIYPIGAIDKIPIATVISPTTFEIINVKSFVLEKKQKRQDIMMVLHVYLVVS